MTIITQRAQVACEIEAVEGTAETLLAADVFLVSNASFTPEIEMITRRPLRASLSSYPSIPGRRSAKMSFEVDLTGTAAAGSALHFSDALQACGIVQTLSAGTSATYTPAIPTTVVPSATLAMYVDGKVYKMWGARGNFKLIMESGKPAIIQFEFIGADWSEADAALFSSGVVLNSVLPPIFVDATFSINSFTDAIVGKLEIDSGNNLYLRPSMSAGSGYLAASILDRLSKISFDPENVLVADEDFLGEWRSGTKMALSASIGATAGNTFTLTCPGVQYQEVRLGDRSGLSVLEITALLCEDTGDDEWELVVT